MLRSMTNKQRKKKNHTSAAKWNINTRKHNKKLLRLTFYLVNKVTNRFFLNWATTLSLAEEKNRVLSAEEIALIRSLE